MEPETASDGESAGRKEEEKELASADVGQPPQEKEPKKNSSASEDVGQPPQEEEPQKDSSASEDVGQPPQEEEPQKDSSALEDVGQPPQEEDLQKDSSVALPKFGLRVRSFQEISVPAAEEGASTSLEKQSFYPDFPGEEEEEVQAVPQMHEEGPGDWNPEPDQPESDDDELLIFDDEAEVWQPLCARDDNADIETAGASTSGGQLEGFPELPAEENIVLRYDSDSLPSDSGAAGGSALAGTSGTAGASVGAGEGFHDLPDEENIVLRYDSDSLPSDSGAAGGSALAGTSGTAGASVGAGDDVVEEEEGDDGPAPKRRRQWPFTERQDETSKPEDIPPEN